MGNVEEACSHFLKSHVFQVRSRPGEMSYDVACSACSRLADSGEDAEVKGTRNSSSGFLGPDYLGAWNRLVTMSLPSGQRYIFPVNIHTVHTQKTTWRPMCSFRFTRRVLGITRKNDAQIGIGVNLPR